MTRYYIHNLDPIAFSIGDYHVPWYWLVYVVGFFYIYLLGAKLLRPQFLVSEAEPKKAQDNNTEMTGLPHHKQPNPGEELPIGSEIENRFHQTIPAETQDNTGKKLSTNRKIFDAGDWADYLSFGWIGLILGSRLGYFSAYQPDLLLNDPSELVRIWAGGMSFHGGLVGATIAILLTARYKKQNPWSIFDVIVTLLPLCLFWGRIANFINGELAGRISLVPWAVVFPSLYDEQPRHPSQLYEAMGEGLILGLIMWRGYKSRLAISGRQSGQFLLAYSVIRFLLEIFREPDRQLGFFWSVITMGQILSLIFFTLGLLLLKKGPPRWSLYHSP